MGTGAPTSFSARPVPPWQVEGDWSNQVQERAPSLGSQPVLLPPRPSPPMEPLWERGEWTGLGP